MTSPQVSGEAALWSGAEYELGATAYPELGLELALAKHEWKSMKVKDSQGKEGEHPRRRLLIEVAGTAENAPDVLSCAVLCRHVERTIMGAKDLAAAPHDAGNFELKKGSDGRRKLEADIDVLEAGLVGVGKLQLIIKPDFPHAGAIALKETIDFDCAVDLKLDGLALGATAEIGDAAQLKPVIAKELTELSGFELLAKIARKRGPGVSPSEVEDFRWPSRSETRDSLGARRWRVGTAYSGPDDDEQGFCHLTCMEADQKGDYECELSLEASLDAGARSVALWSRAFKLRRPVLERFEVKTEELEPGSRQMHEAVDEGAPPTARKKVRVSGKIAGWKPEGLGWAVRVTLWGARADESVDVHPLAGKKVASNAGPAPARLLAEPLGKPISVRLGPGGTFEESTSLWKLSAPERESKASDHFATLSIDANVASSAAPVPVTEVASVDSGKFALVDPDELLEQADSKPRSRSGITEVCSELGKPRPWISCVPHIAAIHPKVRGETLCFEIHLTGKAQYWQKQSLQAAVFLDSPADASGSQPPLLDLPLVAPKDRPHVREASVKMSDPKILGKTIRVVVQKGGDEPQSLELRYRCAPALEHVHRHEREDGSWRVSCGTNFFPTHVDPNVTTRETARFQFYEEMLDASNAPHAVALGYCGFQYDIKSGHEGLVSSAGLLAARVGRPGVIRNAPGKIVLRAEVAGAGGRALGLPVTASEVLIGGKPRKLSCILRFGRCVSRQFKWRLREVAGELAAVVPDGPGRDDVADYLMVAMALETYASFLPDVESQTPTKALGLAQFVVSDDKKIAQLAGEGKIDELKKAGFSTEDSRRAAYRVELARMTAVQQLEQVKNYFMPLVKEYRPMDLEGYYLCVFYPKANQWPPGTVVGDLNAAPKSRLRMTAEQNRSHCDAATGKLTRESVAANVRVWAAKGKSWEADIDDDDVKEHPEAKQGQMSRMRLP